MTTEEFSNEFDTALDSYKRLKNFDSQENLDSLEFNEYEKSVFLTKAQEELIISTYDGRNAEGQTFEGTEESRRSLSSLIKTYSTSTLLDGKIGLSPYSKFFSLPQDLWYITYEAITLSDTSSCLNNLDIVVTPITQDSYYRISKNPFRNAGKRRALRLDASNNVVEIISKYNISKYLVRYLSKPAPIIVSTLPADLTINGIKEKTECELNPIMHRAILERAVKMAFISKVQGTGK